MIEPLTDYEHQILDLLSNKGATLAGDVAEYIQPRFGTNNRQHAGAVRKWLVSLEKQGLVRRLDNEKPVCWVKVSS